MGNTWIAWVLGLPVGGGALALMLYHLGGRGPASSRARLETTALICAVAGIALAMLVGLAAEGRALFLGVDFAFLPPARIMHFVVNVALLCSLFVSWDSPAGYEKRSSVWAVPFTSTLLAGALLAQDGTIAVLCLLGASLVAAGAVFAVPLEGGPRAVGEEEASRVSAKRITGGLKHLSISVVGSGLLVVGVLLLSRYGLNLEKRALLQLGVGLLSIGLLVRAGAMPFGGASADLVDASPGPASNLFGAVTPTILVVGLLLLLPVDRTSLAANSTAWIGAVAVLLAGVRALGVRLPSRYASDGLTSQSVPSELVGATIALQVGWALSGLLSGSASGAAGALLLAVNLALAVPLLIVSAARANDGPRIFKLGLAAGVASLLGLPPFGGFAGTLLVAQATVTLGGFWAALLLLGSLLVAARWISLSRFGFRVPGFGLAQGSPRFESVLILVVVLVGVQFALLAFAGPIGETITVIPSPWLR